MFVLRLFAVLLGLGSVLVLDGSSFTAVFERNKNIQVSHPFIDIGLGLSLSAVWPHTLRSTPVLQPLTFFFLGTNLQSRKIALQHREKVYPSGIRCEKF